ncbi:hypothetical protein SGFS_100310 [Streptomyces graminofaciens]|uniref:Uncharacterized protein n=1 Tax=Streptomyces graminofaciens TaxID=68212 RepID=A0ABN5VZS3_9ACTN|nr:hypothetical protein SGFS_100310 [Streptomyces graminofaciens]
MRHRPRWRFFSWQPPDIWSEWTACQVARPEHQLPGRLERARLQHRLVQEPALGAQGRAGVDRFAHDALGQPGVRNVIFMEGINDIYNNRS